MVSTVPVEDGKLIQKGTGVRTSILKGIARSSCTVKYDYSCYSKRDANTNFAFEVCELSNISKGRYVNGADLVYSIDVI